MQQRQHEAALKIVVERQTRLLENELRAEAQRQRMGQALFDWSLRNAQRTTVPEARALNMRGRSMRRGILVGVWDEQELPADLWSRYRGANDADSNA